MTFTFCLLAFLFTMYTGTFVYFIGQVSYSNSDKTLKTLLLVSYLILCAQLIFVYALYSNLMMVDALNAENALRIIEQAKVKELSTSEQVQRFLVTCSNESRSLLRSLAPAIVMQLQNNSSSNVTGNVVVFLVFVWLVPFLNRLTKRDEIITPMKESSCNVADVLLNADAGLTHMSDFSFWCFSALLVLLVLLTLSYLWERLFHLWHTKQFR